MPAIRPTPNLSFLSDEGSANGHVSIHAVHTRVSERTTTLLSAFAQETAYTRHYGSNQSLSLNARHDARVNEKLSLFVTGTASYDENGQLDTRIISVPDVPILPGSPDIPPTILPPSSDFLAVRGKHYSFAADAGGQVLLSARDSLNFSSGVERSIFRSRLDDTSFWTIPASIGYNRQISSRASAGIQVSFLHTDYSGPQRITTVTPQLTAQFHFSERLSLNGALGASFSSIDDGLSTRHSTGVAANVSLCNAGEQSHLCARAEVDQTVATVAGPAKNISGGVDYTRQLDVGSSIQFSLDASHYSSPASFVSGNAFTTSTYYRAAASYSRQIGSRLFGGVNLSARKLSESGPDPKADVSGSIFIRYRLGDQS